MDKKIDKENFDLNPKKVSSLKMLFFESIPNSWRERLIKTKYRCLRRGKNYTKFEDGIKQYEEEIDIVTLIRDLRWLKMAVNDLMD